MDLHQTRQSPLNIPFPTTSQSSTENRRVYCPPIRAPPRSASANRSQARAGGSSRYQRLAPRSQRRTGPFMVPIEPAADTDRPPEPPRRNLQHLPASRTQNLGHSCEFSSVFPSRRSFQSFLLFQDFCLFFKKVGFYSSSRSGPLSVPVLRRVGSFFQC